MGAIPHMAILAELTSDDVPDTAFAWLCQRRRKYPADADVWSFRQSWPQEKDRLKTAIALHDRNRYASAFKYLSSTP